MTDLDLAELVSSRLCHDLISPVGAIGNGLELVLSEPVASRDDLELIDASARAAQATLSFYRLAFGVRGEGGSLISQAQLGELVRNYFGAGRLRIELPREGADISRAIAKLALLTLLCGAGAAPVGGRMVLDPIRPEPLSLRVTVMGRRVALSETARHLLEGGEPGPSPAPRDAHLILLPRLAAAAGATLRLTETPAGAHDGEGTVALRIAAAGTN
jgi:histidine phosphotransferase ChpT